MNPVEKLNEIEKKLKNNELTHHEEAVLYVEKIWLLSISGDISPKDRVKSLDTFLNKLEDDQPEIFEYLTDSEEDKPNQLMTIASKFA